MEQLEGFMVFWMQREPGHHEDGLVPCSTWFTPNNMSAALKFMEVLRSNPGCHYVTMASQNQNSVGKPGVAAVENGKTPDGQDYTWSKAGRAGKMRKSDFDVNQTSDWVEP